jgi:hypothetical protein
VTRVERSSEVVTIAHRAGNDLGRLAVAVRAGVDLVEADVHLFRGRLEVRHAKTVGPLPLLWDRWEVLPPWRHRLLLDELFDVHDAGILVDLKGRDLRLTPRVLKLARRHGSRPLLLCARWWPHLDAVRGTPGVHVVHSVGSGRELRALLARYPVDGLEGISVHERLLDGASVEQLRQRAATIFTWPVATPAAAERAIALGATGLISDDLEVLRAVADRRASPGARPTGV